MNILIIIPDHDYGGEENRSYKIYQGLKNKGHSLYFASESTNYLFCDNEFIPVPGLNKNLKILFSVLKLKAVIKFKKIDCVLLFKRKSAFLGFFLEKLCAETFFIFNVANAWQDKRFFWKFTPKFIATLSTKLTPYSATKDKRVTKINIGASIVGYEFFQGSPLHEIRLVSAGKLSFQKNHMFLIKVAAALKCLTDKVVVVDIAGDGPYRKKIEAMAEKSNVNLRLRGHVKDMIGFYQEGGIYVQTSNFEGMPNALLEAGLSGLPIVANDVGATGDLINDDTGWLIPNLDLNTYVASILNVIDYSGQRSRNLNFLIKSQYTDDVMISGYDNYLKELYDER